jgi:maleylpyruvate isomerase
VTDDIQQAIAGARAATARLLHTVDGLDDIVASQPSLLPNWSVGHVLTHLARNADSFVRILRGAAEGEELRQYAGGAEERAQNIELGARRPAAELLEDLLSSAVRLDEEWDDAPAIVWERGGLRGDGSPFPCSSLPISRWREVEVHHADLGLGYGVADWPAGFVSCDLPHALDRLPDRIEDAGQRSALLAWIYGRAPQPSRLDLRQF